VLGALAEPVRAGQVPVHVELSAGVAVAPLHATQPADLIRCAVDGLRNAKANRSEVEIYDPKFDLGSEFGSRLFPDLLRAIDNDELITYSQPKVNVAHRRPVPQEDVLRWHHP